MRQNYKIKKGIDERRNSGVFNDTKIFAGFQLHFTSEN